MEQETRVRKLAALVDYSEGSVVSRTLLKKKTGTVTLFAFDEGEGLSEHSASFDALVYIPDGTVQIDIAGKAYQLVAGDTIVLPADVPHAVKAITSCKMLLIMIRA